MAHQGYDNARQRRDDKRKALTAAYNAAHGITGDEPKPCKPVLSLKAKKTLGRVDKAVSVHTTKTYDTLNNCCLPEVAIFSVKSKKNENIPARV